MTQQAISPQQRLELLPFEPTVTSSTLGWSALRLEDYRNLPPSDLALPPLDHHIIALHYKPPTTRLQHRCGGHLTEALMEIDDITYVPAGRDNGWRFDGNRPHCLHILLDHQFLVQLLKTSQNIETSRVTFVEQFQSRDKRLLSLAKLLHSELHREDRLGGLYAESVGTALGMHLITHHTSLSSPVHAERNRLSARQTRHLLSWVEANLEQPISLEQMARQLNLSTYHFARQFRNTLDVTPYQYVIGLRLDRARNLLLSRRSMSLGEISSRCGFSSQSHFSNQFRARFGLSPRAFRQQA